MRRRHNALKMRIALKPYPPYLKGMLKPLILLPGLICDAALWAHQVQHLKDIAAPQVADLTQHDSIKDMATHVLATAPQTFALAGLSMGGYVALEIMRQAPERVTHLALCNTSARPDTPHQLERRGALISLAKTGKFKGVTPKLLPLLVHPDRVNEEALAEIVMDMAERVGRDAFIRQQSAIMGRIDSRPHLPAITCPTLIIAGRQDALTPPEHAQEMHDGIARSQMTVVEDCGHLAPLERPQATTALLRLWLQTN